MRAHFGTLLTELRDRRRLTLEELAEAAETSYATIARVTRRETCPWRPAIKLAVLRTLNAAERMTDEEVAAYCASSGLTQDSDNVRRVLAPAEDSPQQSKLAGTHDLRAEFFQLLARMTDAERASFVAIGDLIASLGAEEARRVLTAACAAALANRGRIAEPTSLLDRQRRLVFANRLRFEDGTKRESQDHTSRKHA